MKVLQYCRDGLQIKGGKWLFWWRVFERWEEFVFAKENNIKEIQGKQKYLGKKE